MCYAELVLWRRHEKEDATAGVLELYPTPYNWGDDPVFQCQTLELPWRDNQRNVSRIPMSDYQIVKRTWGKYYESYKERWGHKFSIEIGGVKDRDAILIHSGNDHNHTRGCPLVGESIKETGAGFWLSDSRRAYNRLYTAVRGFKHVRIKVRDPHDSYEDVDESDHELVTGDRSEL